MNRVRGVDSIREAAQEVQREDLGEEPTNGGPETVALDNTPTMIMAQEKEESLAALAPEVDTEAKGLEDPSPMDLK